MEFGVNVPEYPPADGWTLKYRLVPRFSTPTQDPITLTAATGATVGGVAYDYVITETPTNTAQWKAGAYGWSRWVEKSGARQTLNDLDSRGQLTIRQDPTTAVQGFDNRTQAQTAVDDLKSALATFRASGGVVKSYTIGERSIEFSDETDILKRLSFWQSELSRETAAEKMRAGLKNPRNVYVRMDRP